MLSSNNPMGFGFEISPHAMNFGFGVSKDAEIAATPTNISSVQAPRPAPEPASAERTATAPTPVKVSTAPAATFTHKPISDKTKSATSDQQKVDACCGENLKMCVIL